MGSCWIERKGKVNKQILLFPPFIYKKNKQVVMIVNVASKCGFTKQYSGLEEIYQNYKEKDFVIVGFPCNQFGGQEPGTEEEIQNFCSLNWSVTFPLASKV